MGARPAPRKAVRSPLKPVAEKPSPPPEERAVSESPPLQATGDASSCSKESAGLVAKPVREPRCKVAITLMTRKPHRFDWWLRYHRALGLYHVFVHVEDTPELMPLLESEEFDGFLTVTTGCDNSQQWNATSTPDNYYTLMQRQEVQVRRSVITAREKGIHWLFHVDDDELLHFKEPFARLAAEVSSDVTCVTLVNIEAAPTTMESECVFEDIGVFSQHLMLAYRNGKSAGRIVSEARKHSPPANWHGPHRFTGKYHVVPVERACVLHFESCTYEGWRNKFIKHKYMGEKKKGEIPFPFYRDSVTLFQEDDDGGPAEERWKAFFGRRKIDHFKELTEKQKMKLHLSPSPKAMVDLHPSSYIDWRRCAPSH